MNRMTFLNKDTNDISNMLELALSQYEYTNEQKVRYTFCVEETLLKWQEVFPADEEVTFVRYDRKSSFGFEISIKGKKCDTLADNTSTDILEALVPRIRSGVGHEISYRYSQGVNTITIELPKKKIESTLFYKNIWFVSIPIVMQLILLSVSSTVDAIMLSFLNQDSMSAASLVSSLNYVFNAAIVAFTTSMTTTFGKYWGRRDFDTASRVLGHVSKLSIIVGFIFFVGCMFAPRLIMTLFTDVTSIQDLGVTYMRYLAPYFLLTAISEVFICFMRNAGAVVLSSCFVVVSQIVNIVLNAMLIFGLFKLPAMGVKGAAIATTLSSVCLFALVMGWFLYKKLLHLKVDHFIHLKKEVKKEYNSIMLPLFFQITSWFLGNSVISSILGHMNADVLAAEAIKNTVFNFFACYKEGTGQASGLLQSKTVGQRQLDKVERNSKYIIRFFAVTSGVLSLIFFAGIPFYPYLFGEITERTRYYLNFMLIVSTFRLYFAVLNNNTNTGMFFIAGDTKELIILDTVMKWGIIILFAALGVWVIDMPELLILFLVNCDEIISFPFKHMHYIRGKWLRMLKEQNKVAAEKAATE